MAIGWLKFIQSVPWTDVISNAPKVADGAKGLWERVSKKAGVTTQPQSSSPTPDAEPVTELEQLRADLAQLSDQHQQLQTQVVAATELINSLAQQNQKLVHRIDRMQSYLLWLLLLVVLGALGLIALG